MHIETAPAKINLTIDTLYKRDDGFHEVQMVMTEVDLNDRLMFERIKKDTVIIETEHPFIPTGKKNLIYQSAELLKRTYGIREGVKITLEKNIPVAAGMAGGSTDAAATFRGINTLFDLGLSHDELSNHGATLGSDIPFCIKGGTALATGRGEKIEHLNRPPHAWVVIAKPPISVSTKTIYAGLEPGKHHPASEHMVQAIKDGDYSGILKHMKNDLQEVTMKKYKKVAFLLERMESLGADRALMSGSGPTVYGIVQKERQARQLYNAMKGCCEEVYKVRLMG